MKTFAAIYENGVFRPTEPVDLPEGTRVRLRIYSGTEGDGGGQTATYRRPDERYGLGLVGEAAPTAAPEQAMADTSRTVGMRLVSGASAASGTSEDDRIQQEIYAIMGERYASGDPCGAARHDEHQS